MKNMTASVLTDFERERLQMLASNIDTNSPESKMVDQIVKDRPELVLHIPYIIALFQVFEAMKRAPKVSGE